jgi:hypothetical protein
MRMPRLLAIEEFGCCSSSFIFYLVLICSNI